MPLKPQSYEFLEKRLREQYQVTPKKLEVMMDDVLAVSLAILSSAATGIKEKRVDDLVQKVNDTFADPNMLLTLLLLARKAILQEEALKAADELIQGDREA